MIAFQALGEYPRTLNGLRVIDEATKPQSAGEA
jgi:hypothetical protein